MIYAIFFCTIYLHNPSANQCFLTEAHPDMVGRTAEECLAFRDRVFGYKVDQEVTVGGKPDRVHLEYVCKGTATWTEVK
jgi:hypothetical protein